MRKFYFVYGKQIEQERNKKMQTLSAESEKTLPEFNLSWSHYLFLMGLDNIEERNFYEIEAHSNSWSLRELRRQYDTASYQRLVLSRDKAGIKKLSKKG